MLGKNDLLLLLTTMEEEGIDVTNQVTKLFNANNIPYEVLKFINDSRQLDVVNFYDLLRRNYNHKRSNLYINLVKEEFSNPIDALITLSALQLQIILFAKKLPDSKMFLKHSRAEEISKALNEYYSTYDLIPCLKALRVIKADLMAFESVAGRR